MDSITHALLALFLLLALGVKEALLLGILGAVILDIDILFPLFLRNPRWFMFTHGGFAHSLCGAAAIASLIFGCLFFLKTIGLLSVAIGWESLFLLLGGALFHLSLDFLAYPGIPLFYPYSERKYTIGIFPGPSVALMMISIVYLGLVASGFLTITAPLPYLGAILLYLGFRTGLKIAIALWIPGQTIPTYHPFKWFSLQEKEGTYLFHQHAWNRPSFLLRSYPQIQNLDHRDLQRYVHLPEVRRHRFHSYISIAHRIDGNITFRDPIREEGFILYPPVFQTIEVREQEEPSPVE